MAESWTARLLKRFFSTRRTSSTWPSHCEIPVAASPNSTATDSTPSKPTACSTVRGVARHRRGDQTPDAGTFVQQQRDLYIASGENGFWQAALRDVSSPTYTAVQQALDTRGRLTVDLSYGDLEDGQRTITRFVLLPNADGTWRCDVAHHWRDVAYHHR